MRCPTAAPLAYAKHTGRGRPLLEVLASHAGGACRRSHGLLHDRTARLSGSRLRDIYGRGELVRHRM